MLVRIVIALDEPLTGSLCHQCLNVCVNEYACVVKLFEWSIRLEKLDINAVNLPFMVILPIFVELFQCGPKWWIY